MSRIIVAQNFPLQRRGACAHTLARFGDPSHSTVCGLWFKLCFLFLWFVLSYLSPSCAFLLSLSCLVRFCASVSLLFCFQASVWLFKLRFKLDLASVLPSAKTSSAIIKETRRVRVPAKSSLRLRVQPVKIPCKWHTAMCHICILKELWVNGRKGNKRRLCWS